MLHSIGSTSKSNFNLYHSPAAVVEYGNEYKTPESRLAIANPQDLARIIITTATPVAGDNNKFSSYLIYVHDDASKLLVDALKIVKNSSVNLAKFKITVIAPNSPFTQIKQLAEGCGATAELNGKVASNSSALYQKFDSGTTKFEYMDIRMKFEKLKSKPDASFISVWKEMKSPLGIPSA